MVKGRKRSKLTTRPKPKINKPTKNKAFDEAVKQTKRRLLRLQAKAKAKAKAKVATTTTPLNLQGKLQRASTKRAKKIRRKQRKQEARAQKDSNSCPFCLGPHDSNDCPTLDELDEPLVSFESLKQFQATKYVAGAVPIFDFDVAATSHHQ